MNVQLLLPVMVLMLAMAGCKEPPPPGPDYTALIRKVAEIKASMETGIRLNDASRLAVELRTESSLVTFTNDLAQLQCQKLLACLDLISAQDRYRLVKIRIDGKDPLTAHYWEIDDRIARLREEYPRSIGNTVVTCGDLLAQLVPQSKTALADSGKSP